LSFSVPLNLPCLAGLGEGEYNTPENVKLWESPGKAGGLPLIIREEVINEPRADLTFYPIYGRVKGTERMATILKEIYREETFAKFFKTILPQIN